MPFANPPADLQDWITSDVFKDEHCDFDAVTVVGSPLLLLALGVTTVTVGGIAKPRCSRARMVISSHPYLILCQSERKDAIVDLIQKCRRGEPQVSHDSDQYLLKHPITMFASQFSSLLVDAQVNRIEMRQFGQKGPLSEGFALMRSFREKDPNCDIVFDLGALISPYQFHYPTPHSEMVRHNPESDANPRYITLVHIPDSTYFQHHVHINARANHFPICAVPTVEYFNNSIHPVYGSCYGDFSRFNSEIRKFKIYNTMVHLWKSIYRGDMGKNDTGRIAGRRFAHFHQFLNKMEESTYCPEVRFEISVSLMPDVDFSQGLSIFHPALLHILEIWKSTRAVHLGLNHYLASCRRILDWASSPYLPSELRCFRMRHATKTTSKKHSLYVAIAQCLGFSSPASNALFKCTYVRNENPVDSPLLWLAVQVWRYTLRKECDAVLLSDDDISTQVTEDIFDTRFLRDIIGVPRAFHPMINEHGSEHGRGRKCFPIPKIEYELHLHECGPPIHFRDDGLDLDLLQPEKIYQYCTQNSNKFTFGFAAIGVNPPQEELAQIENQYPDQTPDTIFAINYLDKFLEDHLTVVSSSLDYRANFKQGGGVAAKDHLKFRLYRKIGTRIYDDSYQRYNEDNFTSKLRFNLPEDEVRNIFLNDILPKKNPDNSYVTLEEDGIYVPVAHLYGNDEYNYM